MSKGIKKPVSVVDLKPIHTGLRGFDEIILPNGLPLYSFNAITGHPGSGKTVFTYQLLFNNVSKENKALYFTTISEPPIKVIRYLQQFSFFDKEKFFKYIKVIDLGSVLRKEGLEKGIKFVINKIDEEEAKIVVIDSFKAIHGLLGSEEEIRKFTYDLGVELLAYQCTSFLVGEYTEEEIKQEPIFAIADSILNISSDTKGYLRRRYLEIHKMRGSDYFAGKHRFSITKDGIIVHPRLMPKQKMVKPEIDVSCPKIKTGIKGLDKMLNGGLFTGSSTLVAGNSGTGKTTLALQFLQQGDINDERGLLISFEESPDLIFRLAQGLNIPLAKLVKENKIIILHYSPVELNVDEFHAKIMQVTQQQQIQRVVIDSIADIEVSIGDPTHLKNYILSLIDYFDEQSITSILTSESIEGTTFGITETKLSVIIDVIIQLRYKEEEGRINKYITILKMRGSDHDKEIRGFKITNSGMVIGNW
ncbi:MAG: ATPase domain-containing protein [bacterium]